MNDRIHPTLASLASRTTARRETADVVIVGARVAGAATAMLLARAGHDVLVVDRGTFPSDTISTHALARGGVVQLQRWGLLDRLVATGAPRLRRVEFHAGGEPIVRYVKDRHGVDFLVAPRRHVLDPLLQAAAVEDGARLRTGVSVSGVVHDRDGRVVGVRARDEAGPVEIRARHVVGADGLKSRIARSVGAEITERHESSSSAHYRYFRGSWPALEYHLGGPGFAGVFPTHHGEACVWVCAPDDVALDHRRSAPDRATAFDRMLREVAPTLADRVGDTEPRSFVQGMLSLPNQLRRPVGPGWSLVGDAGYHRDAITGHGITDAFRDAELLAAALDAALACPARERELLDGYHRERDRMLREVFDITRELSGFPTRTRFAELQRQLAVAIDEQAEELAARPVPVRTLAA